MRYVQRLKQLAMQRLLPAARVRRSVASRYIPAGTGLDLGPLHLPFPLPPRARAFNVDYLPLPRLRERYPELRGFALAPVHLVDDAAHLRSVRTGSLDFVVASHVIEHMEDLLGALASWLRVLRPGGRLLVIVPDRRHTFDRDREPTSWEHLKADHEDGGTWSRREHYREWAARVAGVPVEQQETYAESLMKTGYSIHYHVWDPEGFLDHLERGRELLPPFQLSHYSGGHREIVAVLTDTSRGAVTAGS